ncbi:MAG: hypothetical protein AAFR71_08575 [Pseudomonadota bacterium]
MHTHGPHGTLQDVSYTRGPTGRIDAVHGEGFGAGGQTNDTSHSALKDKWEYTYNGYDELIVADNLIDDALDQTLGYDNLCNHKKPLVEEYYQTGAIDQANMRSVSSVNAHCPSCSAAQGGQLSQYSRQMKRQYGLE